MEDETSVETVRKISPGEYEIIRTHHNSAVENYDVLLKKTKDKPYLHGFIRAFGQS